MTRLLVWVLALLSLCAKADAEQLRFQLLWSDRAEVRSLLQTMVPDVTIEEASEADTLLLQGSPGALEQARDLLEQIDLPLAQVRLECGLLCATESEQAEAGIRWPQPSPPLEWSPCLGPNRPNRLEERVAAPGATPAGFCLSGQVPWGSKDEFSMPLFNLAAAPNLSPARGRWFPLPDQVSESGKACLVTDWAPSTLSREGESGHLGLRLEIKGDVKQDGYVIALVQAESRVPTSSVDHLSPVRMRGCKIDARLRDKEALVFRGLFLESELESSSLPPFQGVAQALREGPPGLRVLMVIRPVVLPGRPRVPRKQ